MCRSTPMTHTGNVQVWKRGSVAGEGGVCAGPHPYWMPTCPRLLLGTPEMYTDVVEEGGGTTQGSRRILHQIPHIFR